MIRAIFLAFTFSSVTHAIPFYDLIDAIARNEPGQVQRLISEGVDLNQVNYYGDPPLLDAVRYEHEEIIQILLNGGADVNGLDGLKKTPLHWAASDSSLAVISILVDAGADITAQDFQGRTPIDDAKAAGRHNVVEYLKERLGAGE